MGCYTYVSRARAGSSVISESDAEEAFTVRGTPVHSKASFGSWESFPHLIRFWAWNQWFRLVH
jgi:hypothetical protein